MKKLFLLILAMLCTLLLVGCGVPEEESKPPEADYLVQMLFPVHHYQTDSQL